MDAQWALSFGPKRLNLHAVDLRQPTENRRRAEGRPPGRSLGGGRRWFGHARRWSACQRSDAAGPARVADAPCGRDVDQRPPAGILAASSRAPSPPTVASASPGRSGCGLRRPG